MAGVLLLIFTDLSNVATEGTANLPTMISWHSRAAFSMLTVDRTLATVLCVAARCSTKAIIRAS